MQSELGADPKGSVTHMKAGMPPGAQGNDRCQDFEKGPQSTDSEVTELTVHLIPDGGFQAWKTVFGAWIVQFCTFGLVIVFILPSNLPEHLLARYTNAYGVYQDYYVRVYLSDTSSSTISWIGSVQVFFLFSTGLFAGKLFDKGYFYHLILGGSALFCFCLFMLSLSQPQGYYQVFLCQGLGAGIGLGMTYVPCLGVITHHFQRRRALAIGLAVSGSSVGAVVHPIMLNKLFHGSVGFRDGVRASAGLNLGLLFFAISMMRTRSPPRNAGDTHSIAEIVRDLPYVVAVLGGFFFVCGNFFPYFFLQLDAITHRIEPSLAFYLLSMLNAASFLGRITSGAAANSLGVFNLVILSTTVTAVLIFSLTSVQNLAGFIIFAILFGFFSGALISLFPPMMALFAKNSNEIGARIGLGLAVSGSSGLIGTPIAGALLSKHFIWWRPIIFAGVCMTASATLFAITETLRNFSRFRSHSDKFKRFFGRSSSASAITSDTPRISSKSEVPVTSD